MRRRIEQINHHSADLIEIFNRCFFVEFNTQLVKGGSEPLYLPAHAEVPYHAIFFAHGFFASALHECSHWFVAGEKRRLCTDFGYWYAPDGRTLEQQALFQRVEVKPQALEWILSKAAGFRFHVSLDNLQGEVSEADTGLFKQAVYQQVVDYCEQGLNRRAETFRQALCEFYGTERCLRVEDFDKDEL